MSISIPHVVISVLEPYRTIWGKRTLPNKKYRISLKKDQTLNQILIINIPKLKFKIMAQSKSTKKLFNMAYGLGASVVIIGALFKILHWEFGPLTGGLLLAVGLITEALIFAISAFEPVDDEYDWALVYPELGGGLAEAQNNEKAQIKDAEASLSAKLDELLREAGVDASLMESLGSSIRNFEGAAKSIAPTVDAMESTRKYSAEMVH